MPKRAPSASHVLRLPVSAWALALLAGLLRFPAVPGFDQWYLALFCLVPVLLAVRGRSGRQAFALGFAFALVANLGGYHWLMHTLRLFSSFPLPLCLLLYLLLCSYQALALALFTWLWHRMRGHGVPALAAAPAALLASELLFPLLFPNYLGNAPHLLPVAIQIADLGGPLLISALLAAVNAAFFVVAAARLERRPIPWRSPVIAGVLVALALAYGAYRLRQVDALIATAPRLRVGIVQANLGMFEKHEERLAGFLRHVEQSAALQAGGPLDLLVWPESAYNYVVPEGNLAQAVGLGRVTTPLLFGGLRQAGGRSYNTAFLLDGSGELLGTYDKTYLLLFGEYLPFGELLPWLYQLSPHTGRFTPGSHTRPLPLGRWRLTTLVCYEDILPGFVRKAVAAADPDLLVNITNDAWFGDSVEPWIHLALAKFRAVEHRRSLVRAANSGVSGVIDAAGRLVVHGGIGRPESLTAAVPLTRATTLYQSVGDLAGWLAVGALGGWELVAYRRRRAVPAPPAA